MKIIYILIVYFNFNNIIKKAIMMKGKIKYFLLNNMNKYPKMEYLNLE